MINTNLVGWITSTLTKNHDTDTVTVTTPEDLAGRVVVSVAAKPCGRVYEQENHGRSPDICGLVETHYGAHWRCSAELVTEGGPFALIRVLP